MLQGGDILSHLAGRPYPTHTIRGILRGYETECEFDMIRQTGNYIVYILNYL